MPTHVNHPQSPRPAESKRTPYDDHANHDDHADTIGRWAGLADGDLLAASNADPLRFVADHIPLRDRCEGSVAVLLDLGAGMGRAVNVISDAPPNPTASDCRSVLRVFLSAAEHYREQGLSPAIGLLHHRAGGTHVTGLDRRWANAMSDLAGDAGIPVLGMAARTESGHIVTILADQRGSTAG